MTDVPPDPDLSLVETQHLIDELFRRHDAVVIAREIHTTTTKDDFAVDYHGGLSRCWGMTQRASLGFEDRARDCRVEDDEDDDNVSAD